MILKALWLRPTLAKPLRALATVGGVSVGVAAVISTLLTTRAAISSLGRDVEVISGEARLEVTRPGGVEMEDLAGLREVCDTALLAPVVEGTALQRSTDCVDADLGTIWAARPEFSKHIGDFAMALHEVATRAEARWGPTTRRMGVALGGDQTRMDGQVVELSAADVRQALKAGRLDELATLTVSLHRVWDNGTRQWPVATAMARSLAADQDQDQE